MHIVKMVTKTAQMFPRNAESITHILDYIINGGIAVLVFVIWWFTFRYMIRQHETIINNYEELVKETKREYQHVVKESKSDYADVIEKFITVIQDQMKLNNYVSGLLQRLEGKLDQVLKDK